MPSASARVLAKSIHKEARKLTGDPIQRCKDAAGILVAELMEVISQAKIEGITDEEAGHIIRNVIIDLRDVRQNVIRFRKVQKSD